MHFPIDLHIGPVVIPSHPIFELLAYYLAYRYYAHLRKTTGDALSEETRWSIIVAAAIGALIGSRLLGILEHPEYLIHPTSILYYLSSKTIVGGILGGIIGVEIGKKIGGIKSRTGDLFTFPLLFGIMIGRVGCFLTGVSDGTVGNASNLPWAFDQGDGIARHPTSLYEIIFLMLSWLLLYQLNKRVRLENGILFRIFVVLYLLFRFLVEFLKPDPTVLLGISSIQLASLLMVLYYGYTIVQSFTKHPNASARTD